MHKPLHCLENTQIRFTLDLPIRSVQNASPTFDSHIFSRQKKLSSRSPVTIHIEEEERAIFLIRGERIILDADLAELHGVSTKRPNEQVKRNRERFPEDFVFQLTIGEAEHHQRSRSGNLRP